LIPSAYADELSQHVSATQVNGRLLNRLDRYDKTSQASEHKEGTQTLTGFTGFILNCDY